MDSKGVKEEIDSSHDATKKIITDIITFEDFNEGVKKKYISRIHTKDKRFGTMKYLTTILY